MKVNELNALSRAPKSGDSFLIDTGSDTAKIDYVALADAIMSRMHAYGYTLINNANVTAGNYTLINDRKLTDYTFIVIIWRRLLSGNTWWVVDQAILPIDATTGNFGNVQLSYVDSNNVQRWAAVQFQTNTSVVLTASSNASGAINAFGIKIG